MRVDDDHWEQSGNLFREMTSAQPQVLFENTARAMGDAPAHIQHRHIDNRTRADLAYVAGVAKALGMTALAAAKAAEPRESHGRSGRPSRWLISLVVGE